MADHARGERLKSLRTERHLSQEEAAHEIGVSTKTLRTWEKGGPIKWENAKAAGAAYEVEPESLVEREPHDPADLSEALSAAEPTSALEELLQQVLDQQAQLLAVVSEVRSEQEDQRRLLERSARGAARSRKS